MNRTAFTLIEIMVAMSLAIMLLAVCWTGFAQTRKIAKRAEVAAGLHQQAAMVHRVMHREVSAMQATNMTRLETSCDGRVSRLSLTYMTSLTQAAAYDYMLGSPINLGGMAKVGRTRVSDLVWCRWVYEVEIDPATGLLKPYGRLLHAQNTPYRRSFYRLKPYTSIQKGSSTRYIFGNTSQPRRRWERDLDDNGSAWNWGSETASSKALWDDAIGPADTTQTLPSSGGRWSWPERGGAVPGDASELERSMAPVANLVRHFRIQFEQFGYAGSASFSSGVITSALMPKTVQEPKEIPKAPPAGLTHFNGVFLDGYLDWNNSQRPGVAGSVLDLESVQRPALIRVAFTLVDPTVDPAKYGSLDLPDGTPDPAVVQQNFSFSFPTSSIAKDY